MPFYLQVAEFFLFAILMAITMVIFAIMAFFYQYVKHEREYEMADEKDTNVLVTDDKQAEEPDQPTEQETTQTNN